MKSFRSSISVVHLLVSSSLLCAASLSHAQTSPITTAPTGSATVPAIAPPLQGFLGTSSSDNTQQPGRSSSKQSTPLISIRDNPENNKSKLDTKEKNAKSSESEAEDKENQPEKKEQSATSMVENEFQNFLAESIGKTLPIYGRQLFSSPQGTFAPSQQVAVPADYTLGIGDELEIKTSGSLDISYHATVDRNGKITIPQIGSFSVAGTRYSDLHDLIHRHISRLYKDFSLYINLSELRSIRVYVVGQVNKPGAYTVSSLSTLVNTLLNAGGPSAVGSLRNIQVKRAGKVITDFDLYDFLIHGDKSKDIRLMSEDVIHVAPIGKLIAVNGSVNQPAIYEMRTKETLEDALRFAGGVSTVAATENIAIERIINRKTRTTVQLKLTARALKQALQEGDLITVAPISRKFTNIVTLRGHVAGPMRMQWREGMKIKDLISTKDFLITPDYHSRIEAYGNRISDQTTVQKLAREPNWEYAVIERLRDDLSMEIVPFSLRKALDGDEKNNLPLQQNDVITVFSANDFTVPKSYRSSFVHVSGEFKAGGIYRLKPNETLRQLIERIGGITQDANLYAIEVQRESIQRKQQISYNLWLNKMEQNLLRAQQQQTSLTSDDAGIREVQNKARLALVEKLKSIKPSGRIVLNFKNNFNPWLMDLPDLVLEDGDKIVLPTKTSTVAVVGAVLNDGNFLHRKDKPAKEYISEAGGANDYADIANAYIVRSDGSIFSASQNSGLFNLWGGINSTSIQGGDTIVIPEKVPQQSFLSVVKDFSTVFYQLGLGAAAIQVLRK